jgi:tetratricopeptide (TPR) repeat protein
MLSAVLCATLLLAPADKLVTTTSAGITLASDTSAGQRETILAVAAAAVATSTARCEDIGLQRKSDQSLRLRVFAHESDYDDWRRRTRDQNTKVSPLSFYDDFNREVVAAWQAGSDAARAQLRRQVARFVFLQFARNPSNWFEEGFAGYFQGIDTDAYGDAIDRIDADMLKQIREAIERDRICPLEELLDLQDIEFYGLAGAKQSPWPRAVLYAQSWSLVYWMLESNEDVAKRLLAFEVERSTTGRWDQARGKQLVAEVEPAWRAFVQRDDLTGFGGLVRDAWAAFGKGEVEDARWLATKALDLDESCRSSLRVLGKSAFAQGDSDVAEHCFSELLRGRADDADAALGLAQALSQRFALEPQDAQLLKAVIDAGTRAAELAPLGSGHRGYAIAADAAELAGSFDEALRLVRLAQKARGIGADELKALRDRERSLIKKSIGKG